MGWSPLGSVEERVEGSVSSMSTSRRSGCETKLSPLGASASGVLHVEIDVYAAVLSRPNAANQRCYSAPVVVHDIGQFPEWEKRFATGDPQAFRQAYDELAPLVLGYCQRRLDPQAAEDVAQEVFVELWRSRGRFDPERGTLAAFAMTIARSRLIDHVRRVQRRPETDLDAAVEPAAEDRALAGIARRMLMAHALDQLTENQRIVVSLSAFEGLSHPEIAERTGLPVGTVKSHARRGQAALARYLASNDDSERGSHERTA